jgi:hypothetical protein
MELQYLTGESAFQARRYARSRLKSGTGCRIRTDDDEAGKIMLCRDHRVLGTEKTYIC